MSKIITQEMQAKQFNETMASADRVLGGIKNIQRINQALYEALKKICREAESWHSVHDHGPDSVKCDSICTLIPTMQAALKLYEEGL